MPGIPSHRTWSHAHHGRWPVAWALVLGQGAREKSQGHSALPLSCGPETSSPRPFRLSRDQLPGTHVSPPLRWSQGHGGAHPALPTPSPTSSPAPSAPARTVQPQVAPTLPLGRWGNCGTRRTALIANPPAGIFFRDPNPLTLAECFQGLPTNLRSQVAGKSQARLPPIPLHHSQWIISSLNSTEIETMRQEQPLHNTYRYVLTPYKECVKGVYCHPTYLTYMQSTS